MSKKIEILENTLLKLLVRRGDDLDRKNVTLSEGELGYTTDGKRLFVGDGQTPGGIVTGNVFKGSVASLASVTGVVEGDMVFLSTNNTLYVLENTQWVKVSQVLTAADGSIVIDDVAGTIGIGELSAGNISAGMLGNSIELVGGKISLSGTQVKTDQVSTNSATHLKLPGDLNINAVDYTFPVGGLGNNTYLGTDTTGTLSWKVPDKSSTFYFNSSSAAVPVGAMVESAALSSMPNGWLVADGQTVTSAGYPDLFTAIGTIYGGNATNFDLPDESAAGYVFIKALPDTVVETTLSVTGGLTATKDGVPQSSAFSLLDGAVEIGTPIPGVEVNQTAGSSTFTTKATFTKVWVTGSGSTGGAVSGGAAATVFSILSAPIGTDITYTVGAGRTTDNTIGNDSFISIGGTELARSNGAAVIATTILPSTVANTGTLAAVGGNVVGGYILPGGSGGWDTNSSKEEATGAPSFWGSDQSPGAGSGGHNGNGIPTVAGLVKFEWGM